MTIVCSGCAGFLGYHLTKFLLQEGYYVYGIDNMSYCARLSAIKELKLFKNFKFIESDINDLSELPECDYVIHCAAETHNDRAISNSNPFIHSNISGTTHLLDLIKNKPKHFQPTFVYFSTDEVLGDEPPENGFLEESIYKPSSAYAVSKAAGEMMVLSYARTFGLKYVVVRPTNMYGTHQWCEKLIPLNLQRLDRDQKCVMYGDGRNRRYFLHVLDMVHVIDKLLKSKIINETFNVSGDIILPNHEVLRLLTGIYIKQKDITSSEFLEKYCTIVPNRLGEDKLYHLNDRKIRKALNWRPKRVDFERELELIVNEHRGTIKYWL